MPTTVTVTYRFKTSGDQAGRHVGQLSGYIDSVTLAVQLLFLCRIAVLLTGTGDRLPAFYLVRATDSLAKPLYGMLPPAQIGRFVLEPASGYLIIVLTLVLAVLSVVIDSGARRRTGQKTG